jgi:hypothetical protein
LVRTFADVRHKTVSRTLRLMDLDTHREAFAWVLGVLAERGL